jgi:glycogen operon protein
MRSEGVESGRSFPLGATVHPDGVNFSVFSRDADWMELLLFDSVDADRASRIVPLATNRHRTYHYWHAFVPGLGAGQIYAYRAHGPFAPERGLRFDPEKVLLDPYGLAVAVPDAYDRAAASRPGDNGATSMKSVVADPALYDWENDRPLRHRFAQTLIYELHVRGFTRHPSSGVAPPRSGTFAGLVEKIPYLKELGVTAVELMPVFQFDAQSAPPGLVNYWGYQPVSFFAPHQAYGSGPGALAVLDEFRDMVKALHRNDLEVIIDVVFNHTAEGGHDGPTLSYRGLANDHYYILPEEDRSRYADYTGCGNTINANRSIARRLILDSLRHWVTRMHVDGFRFDLASILSRDQTGRPVANPPILWDIESDPVLAGTKLIAEPWDAVGLYQVGAFAGDAWQEWNGRFRDDARRFIKGTGGVVQMAARFQGSPDLYGHEEREPGRCVNFVTSHDGFTLNDLVSYDRKHNEGNGENNRDGTDDNQSWNCGHEGPTADPEIEALRERQVKNFLAVGLLAAGTPMLLMGDEVRRTQAGNNNAYCHDGEISWFDWGLLEKHAGTLRFVKELTSFRQRRDVVVETDVVLSLNELLRRAKIVWHGVKLHQPDWSEQSHSLAFTLQSIRARYLFHLMMSAYWEPLTFEVPAPPPDTLEPWRRCIDTGEPSPDDIRPWPQAPLVTRRCYDVRPRSLVLLGLALPPAGASSEVA